MADPYAMASYMNPYQQLVLDNQMREARRQSDIMGRDFGLQAAGQGSLGGYREGIMQAERQRNLERQLGDLYGAGMQQAFGQAQQALAHLEVPRLAKGEAQRRAEAHEGAVRQRAGRELDLERVVQEI